MYAAIESPAPVSSIDADRAQHHAEVVADVVRALEADPSFAGSMQQLANVLVPRLGDGCWVDVVDGDGRRMVGSAHTDPRGAIILADFCAALVRRPATWPLRAGRSALHEIADEAALAATIDDPAAEAQLRLLAPRALLVLALTARGRTFGAVTVAITESDRRYTDADRELAEDVAGRAAMQLEAARLLETEQRTRQRAQALQAVTSALSGSVTPEQVGQAVAEHGARALGGSGAAVYFVSEDDGALRAIGNWGYTAQMLEDFGPIPTDAALPIGEAVRERRAVSVDSAEDLLRRFPEAAEARGPGSRWGPICAVPLTAGGDVLGAVVVSRTERRAFQPAERALLEALGRQGGQALERARLYRRQEQANDRLHRLQATTAALAAALTPDEVAATAAAQGAEAVGADSAWVALLDESGRGLALAHAAGHDPATRQRFAVLPLDAQLPLAQAVRTREPLWLESAEAIFVPFPRFAEVRPQAQSAALLPLLDGGEPRGAIGLVFDAPHAFGAEDREYLLALMSLCGQALGRARRYKAEHDVAAALQHALLPAALPDADGVDLAVRYLPAADGTEAGGDFYEAIELPGGRLGIAIGDVVGHGPAAAATMGQLRSALRAYALEAHRPARVLQLLSRYADGVPGARGATLVYAVVDPAAGELRYACAGHPPPLLVAPEGSVAYLEGGRGVPLDSALAHTYADAVAPLPRGATLVLYSDGAIERRGESLDAGLARLAEAAAAAAALDPGELCTRLLEVLVDGARRRDDVALLAARVHAPAVAPLRMTLPALPEQLSSIRRAMRAWLAALGVESTDLVLAAGELCANAIEHAYAPGAAGTVELEMARESGGLIDVLVRDHGRWRPPPADPGLRGRGLGIVRSLMESVDIDAGANGTSVSLRHRPGPARPVA
jgi:GAF domain-containing protein/anti-sigma regulatory factor (Ser/Thr protein kinase)